VALLARLLEMPLGVAPSTVAWSFAASATSGLVAGWYPARRATRTEVITAMRTE
jgi:ABC-type antimicrobial peptide transport system permease subunit